MFDRYSAKIHEIFDSAGVQGFIISVCMLCCVKTTLSFPQGFCDGLEMGHNTKAAIIRPLDSIQNLKFLHVLKG